MRYFLAAAWALLPTLFAAAADPLYFEPNRGQSGAGVRYVARARTAAALILDDGVILQQGSSSVRLTWENAVRGAYWNLSEPAQGLTAYVIGNRAEKWIRDIPHYGRITRTGIYRGIDLVLYGSLGRLEFDFVVHPGADPGEIRFRVSGHRDLAIDPNGDLRVTLAETTFIQRRPRVFQGTQPVDGAYRIVDRDEVMFSLGAYDRDRSLTIDPVLESASLLGGSGDDRIIAADPKYLIVGTTTSVDFPGVGIVPHRGADIFFYNPTSGNTTIVGGSGDDIATCAATGSGLTIGGYTNSRDFPIPSTGLGSGWPQPPQAEYGGGDWDGFVFAMRAGGTTPEFGTYVGGSGDDRVLAVAGAVLDRFVFGGSTTSTDFPLTSAWQSTPGGAVDGFVQVLNPNGSLALSSYAGGSGDDRVLAVAGMPSSRDIWIAGETRSTGWQTPAPWTGSRNGPSDGFLLRVATDAALTKIQPAQGLYFGGSGDDRFTALAALPNGNLAAAGVTSSQDLTPSSTYGGGDSDVFLAQFSSDLRTVVSTSYLGGSGADEALSLVTNNFDEVLVGGWTNSPDFPVTAGLESSCGKGGEDGFLAHFDSSGQRILATCYGGKGNDRITSVVTDGAQHIYIAGYSDSPDLPLKDPIQPLNAGGSDGFFASFSVPVIHAEGLSVGKDLTGAVLVTLGDSTNYIGTTVTVTSADATSVLLAARAGDPGQSLLTLAKGTDSQMGSRDFLVYCLTDAATVPVTLSASGYAARTITIRCVPSALFIDRTDIAAGAGSSVTILPAAIDPATQQPLALQVPRAGLDPIRIDVSNPSPDVISFSTSTVTIDQFSTLTGNNVSSFSFRMKAAGSADVFFSSNSPFPFAPASVVHIRGNPAQFSAFYSPRAARQLMSPIWIGFPVGQPTTSFPVTFTTSDPTKVLISPSRSQHGQPSLTVNWTPNSFILAWIEILETGDVWLTASSPGMEPVTQKLSFGELALGFFYNSSTQIQRVTLAPGQSLDADVRLVIYPVEPIYSPQLPVTRPQGVNTSFRLDDSDPTVAGPSVLNYDFPVFGDLGTLTTVHIDAKSGGTAVFKLVSSQVRTLSPLNVEVSAPGVTMQPVTVGNNLTEYLQVTGLGRQGMGPVTFTSSNPTRVLLSAGFQQPGAATVSTQSGPVWVHGLSDHGTAEIIATADGLAPVKTTVTLVPAGLAWSLNAIGFPLPYTGGGPYIISYALDPVTLVPILRQDPRPGLPGSVDLQVADPSVASVSPASIAFSAFGPGTGVYNLTFSSVGGGQTTIAIVQPPGFVQPAGHGPLRATALSPLLTSSIPPLGRNLQAALTPQFGNMNVPRSSYPPITITSSDPARLLLSTGSVTLGGASVVSNFRGGAYAPVYMQALDGPADVLIKLSADGALDATATVQIHPTAITLGLQFGDTLNGSTQQDSLPLTAAVSLQGPNYYNQASWTLRAGLDPIPLTVTSSNPSVATVPTSPILNSLTSQTTVTVKPLAPGNTDLSVVPPPGFVLPPANAGRTVHVKLSGPSFVTDDVTLARDVQQAITLRVQNGVSAIPSDVEVTITSGDPNKVLLSANASTVGSGSLAVHFFRGDVPAKNIYVQALDQSGTVTLSISAPGYGSSASNVKLVPLGFATDLGSLANNTSYTLRVRPIPITTPPQSFFSATTPQFRAGFAGVTIGVASSNTSIATVSPATLTWTTNTVDQSVTVKTVAAGTAQINFSVPDPYIGPPGVNVTATATEGVLNLSASSLTLGKDLVGVLGVQPSSIGQTSVKVTVTTSDSSRVLLASSASAPGQASIDINASLTAQTPVYVHAFSDNGTVAVRFSAPGYKSVESMVQLTQAEVVMQAPFSTGTLTPLSAPVSFKALLQTVAPNNFSGNLNPAPLRPGAAPLRVPVDLSDATIGTVTPSTLTFNPGDSSQSFSFQPASPGSVLLALGVPPGFSDPLARRQQFLTVVPARANLSLPASVGKDMVRSNMLALSSPAGQSLSLTLTSSDPSRLLLSTSASAAGSASITVNLVAGGTTSTAFNLIGLADSGTAFLTVSGAPLTLVNTSVTLQPSGFVFTQPPGGATVNSVLALFVQSVMLNPQTLAADTPMPLRAGIAPLSINVATSNAAVIPAPAPIFYYPGDLSERVSVTPKTAGSTTLTIQQPAGFPTPSSGASTSITVR